MKLIHPRRRYRNQSLEHPLSGGRPNRELLANSSIGAGTNMLGEETEPMLRHHQEELDQHQICNKDEVFTAQAVG